MKRDKLIWPDLETGGLDPRAHDITQLAFILEIGGKVVEEVELLMRPDSPERVSAEALDVQKRTLDQVMAHPLTQRQGYEEFVRVLSRHVDKFDPGDKLTWIGQNPRFDQDFVRELWRKQGDKYFGSWFMQQPVDLISLVVAAEMRGYFRDIGNRRLATVCNAMGIDIPQAHRALDDIRATRQCFRRLTQIIPECGEIQRCETCGSELVAG
jgi:DNA polymerase III alpha subunit (gram-positive type)